MILFSLLFILRKEEVRTELSERLFKRQIEGVSSFLKEEHNETNEEKETLLDILASLKVIRTIEEGELEYLGEGPEVIKIKFKENPNVNEELMIGQKNPLTQGLYVKFREKIYLVEDDSPIQFIYREGELASSDKRYQRLLNLVKSLNKTAH